MPRVWEDRINRKSRGRQTLSQRNIQEFGKGDTQGIEDSKLAASVSVNLRQEKNGMPMWLRMEVGDLDKDSK